MTPIIVARTLPLVTRHLIPLITTKEIPKLDTEQTKISPPTGVIAFIPRDLTTTILEYLLGVNLHILEVHHMTTIGTIMIPGIPDLWTVALTIINPPIINQTTIPSPTVTVLHRPIVEDTRDPEGMPEIAVVTDMIIGLLDLGND